MDETSRQILEEADRHSEVVRLTFRDGSSAEARVRDLDFSRHRTVTYLDLDHACCAMTADLDDIVGVSRTADAPKEEP